MLAERLLCSFTGVVFTRPPRLHANVTLEAAVKHVRTVSSDGSPQEVMVLLLVDEIRKITDTDRRGAVLDILNTFVQRQQTLGLWTIAVVSCLDMASLFDLVTARSQRRLYGLRVDPCSETDGNVFFEVGVSRMEEATSKMPQLTSAAHRKNILRFAIEGCGGHFRSIESVMRAAAAGEMDKVVTPPNVTLSALYAPAALEVIAEVYFTERTYSEE